MPKVANSPLAQSNHQALKLDIQAAVCSVPNRFNVGPMAHNFLILACQGDECQTSMKVYAALHGSVYRAFIEAMQLDLYKFEGYWYIGIDTPITVNEESPVTQERNDEHIKFNVTNVITLA